MNRRIAVRGIIVHQGKLLCFKLIEYKTKKAMDFWCVPGGGVDDNESLLSALKREMIEETGINPKIGSLLYVQQFNSISYPNYEEIEFFFHIKNPADYINIKLEETTHGMKEVAEFGFIDPSQNTVLPEFLQTESLDNIEKQKTKFFSYL